MEPPGRVGLVDGSDDAQEHGTGLAGASSLDVTLLASASEAQDAVDDGDIDCLVARQDLPDGAGLDLLRDVRENHPTVPFILLTTTDAGDILVDALHAGATDLVPIDTPDLYRILAERIEDAIEGERARIAARDLERIASVIRDVNRTLLWASTRESLLWRTCRILSRADPYVFAWVGLVDEETGDVEPAAWGGIGEDYLDEITITTDDTPTGRGPAGEAIRTGTVSVIRDATSDPRFEPWREQAERFGFRSVAGIPLTYQDHVYGVLSVYADRPVAFDSAERSMLAEVGNDVGYALHALDVRGELERHAELVAHAPIGIFTTEPGPNGRILEANPALARILDANGTADLLGRRVTDLYADPGERTALLGDLDTDQEASAQIRLRTLAGRDIVAHVTVVQIRRPDGSTQLMGAMKDVTRRVGLETDLAEERRLVEELLEVSPIAIVVLNPDGDIVRANAQAEDVLGISRSELLERRYDAPEWELFDEAGREIPPEDLPFARALETKRPVTNYEHGIRLPTGEERWLSVNAVPILDDDEVQRVVTAVDDVTEHRHNTAALEWERDRFRAIFEEAFDAIVIADDDGRYTAANPAAADLFGVPREKLLGQTIQDFATDDFDFEAAWTGFRAREDERGIFELERPSGERRVVEYSASSDVVPGQHLSILRDITDRLEYEHTLREQNRRLETVLANAPVVLLAFDADGTYSFVAGKGMAETGFEADDLVGETFYTQFHDQPDAIELLEGALAGEAVHGVVRFGGRDFEVWAEPIDGRDREDSDGDGAAPAVIGVAMDVTDARAAEADVRARQDQIAFFNSLLRHEVLNGLAVVLGNADILRDGLPADHELAPNAERIYSRSDDIVDIVRRIRKVLSKLAVADTERTVQDLVTVTASRVAQLESDYPEAEVSLDAPDHAPVYGDDLLGDVVYNVGSNAILHKDQDVPTVDLTITPGSAETVLRVADNGPGIPDRVLELIFQETNQDRNWATAGSFGLYFVTTMVDRYGGSIDVTPRDPRGTIVEIRFPTAPPLGDDEDTPA